MTTNSGQSARRGSQELRRAFALAAITGRGWTTCMRYLRGDPMHPRTFALVHGAAIELGIAVENLTHHPCAQSINAKASAEIASNCAWLKPHLGKVLR